MKVPIVITLVVLFIVPQVYSLSCTAGLCCKDGNVLPGKTVCRQSVNQCDITEHCSGFSSDCPPDVIAEDDTFCRDGAMSGVCYNGTCMTEETIAGYETCEEICSNGKCTLKGECVCNEGWQSPPNCDIKVTKANVQEDLRKVYEDLKLNQAPVTIKKHDEQTLSRNRRELNNKNGRHHRRHHGHIESDKIGEKHTKMLSIQENPHKDGFTKLTNNPMFVPLVITIVVFVILITFTIAARIMYKSEMKAQSIRRRIKVEKTRSEIPKITGNVSKIDDPAVNIDVGR